MEANPYVNHLPFDQPLDYPHERLVHSTSMKPIAGCQLSEWQGWKAHHSPDCPGCMVRLAAAAVRSPNAAFRVIETGQHLTMVEGFRLRVPDETDPIRVMFERALREKRRQRRSRR